ncbi:MAG: hypothetical protein KGL39_50320, partial [Patescibacteria group bacterium]|nr:hypothetical protein [Patescibacteria group bacterium]
VGSWTHVSYEIFANVPHVAPLLIDDDCSALADDGNNARDMPARTAAKCSALAPLNNNNFGGRRSFRKPRPIQSKIVFWRKLEM